MTREGRSYEVRLIRGRLDSLLTCKIVRAPDSARFRRPVVGGAGALNLTYSCENVMQNQLDHYGNSICCFVNLVDHKLSELKIIVHTSKNWGGIVFLYSTACMFGAVLIVTLCYHKHFLTLLDMPVRRYIDTVYNMISI